MVYEQYDKSTPSLSQVQDGLKTVGGFLFLGFLLPYQLYLDNND